MSKKLCKNSEGVKTEFNEILTTFKFDDICTTLLIFWCQKETFLSRS